MLKQLFYKFIHRLMVDDIIGYAAQISFYLLVSLVPFITLLLSALGHFHVINADSIVNLIMQTQLLPEAVLSLIKQTLNSEIVMPSSTVPLYIFVVLWFASRGVRAIMNCIHMTFRTREVRNLLKHFLMSFIYTISFIVILILFMVLIVYGDNLVSFLSEHYNMEFLVTFTATFVRYSIPLVFLFLIYTLLYKLVPAKELKTRDVLPGSVTATLVSYVVSQIFSSLTTSTIKYSALYGGISGIIILTTWMYLFSSILIIGSELNACIYEIKNNTTLISIH